MATIVRRRKVEPLHPRQEFGVKPDEAHHAMEQFLRRDAGVPKPFCTCQVVKGYSFDPQMGIYLHAVADCWKPSKMYYAAAVAAGIIEGP